MHIFFAGIGGVGIGPLAEIARDSGYQISGSDTRESLMTTQLLESGARVHIGAQDGAFIASLHAEQPIDWFVFSTAVSHDNAELVFAKEHGIKTTERDGLLSHIIDQHNLQLLAVSGTHGKTTTTGMLVWSLMQLGEPLSYSIGSTISFGPSGKFDPAARYFVYECDEFNKNMLHFNPEIALIPSLDYDHPDTYPTIADYQAAFRQFALQSSRTLAWDDQSSETYDNLPGIELSHEINHDITLAGLHNRRNATQVLTALVKLGFEYEACLSALNKFPGTARRFEKIADNLYSDYAHHPVEIAASMQLASELSQHVIAVYQPHQNIRQHELLGQYTNQFKTAEHVYWLPTYLSREDPNLAVLTPEQLTQTLSNRDHVSEASLDNSLWEQLSAARQAGKLVLCMGAGDIDSWLRSRLAAQ